MIALSKLLLVAAVSSSLSTVAYSPDTVGTTDSNTTLNNIPSTVAKTIVRLGHTARGDAPPLLFKSSNSACSLNGGLGDGGSQVKSFDSKCWLAVWPSGVIDPTQFGASGAGSIDAKAAIQAAIDVASPTSEVVLPCGHFKIASALSIPTSSVAFGGTKGGCTIIEPSSGTINGVVVTGNLVQLHDLNFQSPAVTRSAGSYVAFQGTGGRLYDSIFYAAFVGLTISGSDTAIDRNWIYNTVPTTGKGIVVTAGAGLRIGYTVMDAPNGSQPFAGVHVTATDDLSFIGGSQFIHQGIGLNVVPGNGQVVASLSGDGPLYFDNDATGGINLCPTGTGKIVRSRFVAAWTSSSSGGSGVTTCAGVLGSDFIDLHSFLNAGHGFNMNGGSEISIIGGQFAQNGLFGIASVTSKFNITGAMIGAVAGLTQNTSGGVSVGGSADYYQVVGNTFVGQTTATSLGTSGTHKSVFNNPGDQTDFSIYRDSATGVLFIVGQEATFSGYKFITPAGTAMILGNTGAPTLPGLPTSAGGGGLSVCVDTAGAFYKKAACP